MSAPHAADRAREALLDEGLMSVKDVAAFFGVTRSQVYKLLARGELPCVRVGKRGRRLPRRAVREYAAARLTLARGQE